jgi:hypothetical protein
MEGPRAAKPEDLPEIVNLVNQIFMLPTGFPPIMGDLFRNYLIKIMLRI